MAFARLSTVSTIVHHTYSSCMYQTMNRYPGRFGGGANAKPRKARSTGLNDAALRKMQVRITRGSPPIYKLYNVTGVTTY